MQRQYRTNSSRRQFCRRLFCISGHMRSSAYTPVWLRLDKFVKISYDRKAIKNACTVRNERGIAMEHNHLHDHAAALPAQMPPESQLADVAELFKIFGDLTRVRIIFDKSWMSIFPTGLGGSHFPPASCVETVPSGHQPAGGKDHFLCTGGFPHLLHFRTGSGTHSGMR